MPEDQNQPQTFSPSGPTPNQPPVPQPMQAPGVINPTVIQPQVVAPAPAAAVPVAPAPVTEAAPAPQAPVPPQPPVAPGAVPGPMPPQAPVMPAAPVFGQPSAMGGAFAPNPGMLSASSLAGSSRKTGLYIKLGSVGAVVVIAIVTAVVLVLGQGITKTDVSDALKTLSSIDSDLSDASTASLSIQETSSSADVTSNASTITSKLNDAQAQYNKLKHSKVLNDSNVKAKFNAVDAKWQPFIAYEKGNANDLQVLAPILADFQSSQKAVSQPSSLSNVGPYLASLKTLYDATSTKLGSTKMSVAENQQIVDALKTFLQQASSAINTAQADLAAGKSGSTVEDDLFAIDDAETTFSDVQYKAESAQSKKEEQLNPDTQFIDLLSALDKLAVKVSK